MSTEPQGPASLLQRLANHFTGLCRKLLDLRDTPHAIAGGVAIGMFWGFTPLFGVKTLLSLGTAWVTRCSKLAAVISVCLNDVVTPFWPVILRFEYDFGYWLLSHPHRFPPKLETHHLSLTEMLKWTTFLDVGLPLLVGSMAFAVPAAIISYVVTYAIVKRRPRKPLSSAA